MADAQLVDANGQWSAASEQIQAATVGLRLDRAADADGAAAFDWGAHTPGDLAGAYRTIAYWLAVGGRLLQTRGLAYPAGQALTWAATYGGLPFTLSYNVSGVLTGAADTLQAAIEESSAPTLAKADVLTIVGQLRSHALAAQQLADKTTLQGRIEGWVSKLEGWAKVAGLVAAATVAGMLGWGAYRVVRFIRG